MLHVEVEYKEMDDHLAHLSEDEYYSEEDRKEKEKEKDKSNAVEPKEAEKPVIKPEDLEPEKADPDKPQPDDPTGKTHILE